jgi:hypothetical protein
VKVGIRQPWVGISDQGKEAVVGILEAGQILWGGMSKWTCRAHRDGDGGTSAYCDRKDNNDCNAA